MKAKGKTTRGTVFLQYVSLGDICEVIKSLFINYIMFFLMIQSYIIYADGLQVHKNRFCVHPELKNVLIFYK